MKLINLTLGLSLLCCSSVVIAENKNVQVRPGKIHENCVKLKASENLKYSFTSSAAVDFNIHYHLGKQVKYPVKLTAVKKQSASFKANLAQQYCLMWSNKGDQTIQLSFKHDRS